jgi:hypothetical protein
MTTPARLGLAFAGLFALASLPILAVELPPLLDYPNHLARMAVLADGGRSSAFERYYQIHWALLPNLAMDALVPLLAQIMPLLLAGKLFLLLTLGLMAAGPVLLSRAVTGAWSWWPLTGFLLLYNRILLWGFVNFLFGLGLGLCVAALWMALARRPVWRAVAGIAGVALVFFSHIEACALLALMMLGLEWPAMRAGGRASAARILGLTVPFILPALIVATAWHPPGEGVDYARFWRKADLLFTVFDNYSRGFDAACFALCLVALGAAIVRRRLALAPGLVPVLILVALAYIAAPTAAYTGSAADRRVPVLLFLVLVAAIVPGSRPIGRAVLGKAVTAALLGLMILRWAVVGAVWQGDQAGYRADLAMFSHLPTGSRIAVAALPDTVNVTAMPLRHLPVLAVATRQAFVPTLFAYPSQQPVLLRPPWDAVAAASDPAAIWIAAMNAKGAIPVLRAFDAVVFLDGKPIPDITTPCLTPVGRRLDFQVYWIEKDDSCADK